MVLSSFMIVSPPACRDGSSRSLPWFSFPNDDPIDQAAPQDARKKCRQETPAVDRTDRLNAKNGCHRQGNATIYKSDEHAHREVRENALPELIAAIPTAQRFFIPELYRTRRSRALIRAETPECS
jgi:hypothetical protein